MAYSETLAHSIREALSGVPHVEEKKMFGALAFMVNGKMCLAAGKDRIMCRIDPATHQDVTATEGVDTVIMGKRRYTGYIYVHESLLGTEKDLGHWIGMALRFRNQLP